VVAVAILASGGPVQREIGRQLADRLGARFLAGEVVVKLASERSGIPQTRLERHLASARRGRETTRWGFFKRVWSSLMRGAGAPPTPDTDRACSAAIRMAVRELLELENVVVVVPSFSPAVGAASGRIRIWLISGFRGRDADVPGNGYGRQPARCEGPLADGEGWDLAVRFTGHPVTTVAEMLAGGILAFERAARGTRGAGTGDDPRPTNTCMQRLPVRSGWHELR